MEALKTAMLCAYMECSEKELNSFLFSVWYKYEGDMDSQVLALIEQAHTAHLEPTLSNLIYLLKGEKA